MNTPNAHLPKPNTHKSTQQVNREQSDFFKEVPIRFTEKPRVSMSVS